MAGSLVKCAMLDGDSLQISIKTPFLWVDVGKRQKCINHEWSAFPALTDLNCLVYLEVILKTKQNKKKTSSNIKHVKCEKKSDRCLK